MKKIILVLLLSTLLVSCSEEEINTNSEVVKKDFNVEIKNINEFSNTFTLEKTGKLSSTQAIKLSSHASGRVSNIYVVEGEKVYKGDIIARLEDNIANYGLALQRAKNSLNKAKINYESTENQLNKNISDLKINLGNLKIDETNSKSSLELEKLDNSLNKIVLDYENLKTGNLSTISGFKNSMGKDLVSFNTFIDDVIDFSDKLLGVTYENKDENDDYEDYLGVKDIESLQKSKNYLLKLIDYKKNNLKNINFNFEGTTKFETNILTINDGYTIISSLLTNMDFALDNSVESVGSLSSNQISLFKSNISSFWSIYNLNNGTFVATKNSIETFLDTYENKEKSLLKQIELLNSDKKIYIKGLDVKLEIDESTLEEAITNKDLTLRQLNAVIVDSKIAYEQALSNFNKLVIKAPITGTIGSIGVDVGQEVSPGTLLFNLSNNSNNEASISFSKDELDIIKLGNVAYVKVGDTTYTGSIKSISSVADSNLKYISKVGFDNDLNFTGDIVNITIPVNLDKTLLPLTLFSVKKDNIGLLNIIENNSIDKVEVYFGNFYGDLVEIKGCVNLDEDKCNNLNIVTNDISNFDNEKFNLMIK